MRGAVTVTMTASAEQIWERMASPQFYDTYEGARLRLRLSTIIRWTFLGKCG